MPFPDWLELIRLAGTFLIWLILPLQIWSIHRQYTQHQRWERGEDIRLQRWEADMAAIAQLKDEAFHLRVQAEVSLALARQQTMRAPPEAD